MITARPQKNLRHAKEYFHEHLSCGDYYSEKHAVAGQWQGRAAERLGLHTSTPVTEEAFLRLCENQHPQTGAKLTVRQRKERRVFYDFVISAPKSISILAITMGDERLLGAHNAACRDAIAELEKAAATRIRTRGQRATRLTGEFVAASFQHDCSRALDPQLHTHLVVFNATWDSVEGRWKALEPEHMFAQTKFLTEVYRNALATEVARLGYEIRPAAHGFEIAGVSDEIIARFSKRSRAIREAEAKLAGKLGQPLTNDGRAALAHSTRARKQRDLPSSQMVALQRSQLTIAEFQGLQRLVQTTLRPKAKSSTSCESSVVAALHAARDHLFERHSVVPEHELLRHALAFGRGTVSLGDLTNALAKDRQFIRKAGNVTTRDAAASEYRLIDLVNAGIGAYPALRTGHSLSPHLNGEQRHAVQTILRSTDGVICLRGGAGTGKTTALRELAQAVSSHHREVLVLAPMSGAVEVLREEGFSRAETLQRFLVDDRLQAAMRGHVLIADEAGTLSVRQLHSLLEIARRNGCRVVLSGDTRQHGSVEAGDALRLLEDRSHLRTVGLNSIRRQISLEYRRAIDEVAKGQPLRALTRLDQLGAIAEIEGELRHKTLAKDYAASLAAGKSALIVSPTRRETQLVNESVRQALIADGHLTGTPASVSVLRSEQWTAAQRRDFLAYRPEYVLVFHRATRDFARGEAVQVVSASADRLEVTTRTGKSRSVTRKQSDAYDIATRQDLEVQPGDRLLLQANQRDAKLLNGQIVTVQNIRADGQLDLTDGRSIPPSFRQFTHGYCVTSPGSQGKTADHVWVAMDSASGAAANQKQFYVSASRGREQIKIYTDDRKHLREAVEKPGDRLLATEWLKPKQAVRPTERPAPKTKIRP